MSRNVETHLGSGARQVSLFDPGEPWRDSPSLIAPPKSSIPAVNVATVPQRSPLRYPGGKTWLIPHIRAWLGTKNDPPHTLVEPFAGGGIVSLTSVMEALVNRCLMCEIDPDVSAFWQATLGNSDELAARVRGFEPTRDAVNALAQSDPSSTLEHGFRTLVLNRTRRGGILAPGASLARSGENGKGVGSRWYPETLVARLEAIARFANRIEFVHGDGIELLESSVPALGRDAVLFIDPPYTAGGKRAGKRLYAHHEIDHERLFTLVADSKLDFLMTYDDAPEIVALVSRHGFHAVHVLMKNTHHIRLAELVITRRPIFGA